jgi:hypothetical protein
MGVHKRGQRLASARGGRDEPRPTLQRALYRRLHHGRLPLRQWAIVASPSAPVPRREPRASLGAQGYGLRSRLSDVRWSFGACGRVLLLRMLQALPRRVHAPRSLGRTPVIHFCADEAAALASTLPFFGFLWRWLRARLRPTVTRVSVHSAAATSTSTVTRESVSAPDPKR